MNNELINDYVNKYQSRIEQYIPDLAGDECEDPFNPDMEELRDTIEDFAADHIHDGELMLKERFEDGPANYGLEIREAAKRIATHYCG